jgi:hypothetical protein
MGHADQEVPYSSTYFITNGMRNNQRRVWSSTYRDMRADKGITELQKRQAAIPVFILRLSLKALLLFSESVPPSLIQELELPILEVTINVHLPAFVSTEERSSFQYPQTTAQRCIYTTRTPIEPFLHVYLIGSMWRRKRWKL